MSEQQTKLASCSSNCIFDPLPEISISIVERPGISPVSRGQFLAIAPPCNLVKRVDSLWRSKTSLVLQIMYVNSQKPIATLDTSLNLIIYVFPAGCLRTDKDRRHGSALKSSIDKFMNGRIAQTFGFFPKGCILPSGSRGAFYDMSISDLIRSPDVYLIVKAKKHFTRHAVPFGYWVVRRSKMTRMTVKKTVPCRKTMVGENMVKNIPSTLD